MAISHQTLPLDLISNTNSQRAISFPQMNSSKPESALRHDVILMNEDGAGDWRAISEACEENHWTPDTKADSCQHPGCAIRFGYGRLPGVSFSTSLESHSFQSTEDLDSRIYSPWTRRTSASSTISSIDSMIVSASSPIITLSSSPQDGKVELLDDSASSMTTSLKKNFSSSSLSVPSPPSTPQKHMATRSNSIDSLIPNISTAKSSFFRALSMSPIKMHRRHHCRRCGQCYCSSHSGSTATLIRNNVVSEKPICNDRITASSALKNVLEQDNGGTTGDSSHFIRARVCDECFKHCQRAKERYLQSRVVQTNNEVLAMLDSDGMISEANSKTPTCGDGIINQNESEDGEFIQSRNRILLERQREQRELLKAMCNSPSANWIAASSAAEQVGDPSVLTACTKSPIVNRSVRHAIGLQSDSIVGPDLISMSAWEVAELKQRQERVTRVALSLDSLHIRSLDRQQPQQSQLEQRNNQNHLAKSNQYSQASSLQSSQAYTRSPLRTPSPLPNLDEELLLEHKRDLEILASPTGWQRRWTNLRQPTLPILPPRPGSICSSSSPTSFYRSY